MLPGNGSFTGRTLMFVGRSRELAALKKAVASHPDYQVLNIHGPGGIGKTHLLYRFTEELGAQDACVIWLNAREVQPSPEGIAQALHRSLSKAVAPSPPLHLATSYLSPSQSAPARSAASSASQLRQSAAAPATAPGRRNHASLRRAGNAGGTTLEDALELVKVVGSARQTVVVIDDYEAAPELDGLFRRWVLPLLDPRVLVVIASWHPLTRLWEGDPASLAGTRCLALRYLTPEEAEEFLQCRGIAEQGTLDRIILFAGGLPLALALAADAELDVRHTESAGSKRKGEINYQEVAHEVFQRIVREIPDEEVLGLLEAACMVRRCNEELLSHLAGRPVTALNINKLTSLSFARLTKEGLTIDDEIRNTVLEDMRWRAPGRLSSLRRLAMHWFEKGKGAPGTSETVECLFFANDSLLRRYFFTEWGEVAPLCDGIAPSSEELTDVFCAWLRGYLGQDEDRLGEADQISRLFELYPDRFITARERDGRLAGFTCLIPVEERSLPVLRMSEVTRLCLDNLPDPCRARHIVLFPFVISSAHAYQVRAALVQGVIEWQIKHDMRAVFTTWVHDEMAASRAEQLHFTRLQAPVCTAYGPGMPVAYYFLDLTKKSVHSWINEVLGREQGAAEAALSHREMIQDVVSCLRHFWDDEKLEHSKMARLRAVAGRLGRTDTHGGTGETSASAVPVVIRSVLRDAISLLAQGTGRFAFRFGMEEAKLIRLAYIDRVGSHERVMERLGLPRTTYYRRLRQALRNLASILAALEDEQERM